MDAGQPSRQNPNHETTDNHVDLCKVNVHVCAYGGGKGNPFDVQDANISDYPLGVWVSGMPDRKAGLPSVYKDTSVAFPHFEFIRIGTYDRWSTEMVVSQACKTPYANQSTSIYICVE